MQVYINGKKIEFDSGERYCTLVPKPYENRPVFTLREVDMVHAMNKLSDGNEDCAVRKKKNFIRNVINLCAVALIGDGSETDESIRRMIFDEYNPDTFTSDIADVRKTLGVMKLARKAYIDQQSHLAASNV